MFQTTWPLTRVVSPRSADGKSDELFTRKCHVLFAIFLTALALLTTVLQYFFRPAECWCPEFFTGQMVNYVNSFCFFTEKYYLPTANPFIPTPQPITPETNYFKWTPFALLFLAALYVIPEIPVRMGWKIFAVNLGNILELARACIHGNRDSREDAIKQLTVDLQSRFDHDGSRSRQTTLQRWLDRLLPTLPFYIRLQHFSSKLAFLIGSIVPIIVMHTALQVNFNFRKQVWSNSNNTGDNQTYFPTHILCEFDIRQLQNVRRFTVQCNLPANDLFQRLATLVGFLALVVSTVSSSDFVSFLIGRLFEPWNSSYARRLSEVFAKLDDDYDQQMFAEFIKHYLRKDGLYLIRLIGQNSSEAIVRQIVKRLWKDYMTKLRQENPMLRPLQDVLDGSLLENIELQNDD